MGYSVQKDGSKQFGVQDADATLRLIAGLPAPEGLEDRVHARLRVVPRKTGMLSWPAPLTRQTDRLRGVAAAAIVCVVAGGGWGIYSRVMPGQAGQAISGARDAGAKSFATGEARRRPQTLEGPTLPQSAITKAVPAKAEVNVAPKSVSKHPRPGQVNDANAAQHPAIVAPVQ